MKSKVILALALVSLIAIIPMVPTIYAQEDVYGPISDVLRHLVISSPDAALLAMQTGLADVNPDMILTANIEALKLGPDGEEGTDDDMRVTDDLGFHMGFIAYNLRADQAYRRDDITYWPCKDVEFRQALILSYDQLGIIPPIYGYTVTPVRSLVPPAQSRYYNTAVPTHEYNPGVDLDPESPTYLQLTYEEGSSTGILRDEWGGTFVDNNGNGIADPDDYWLCPNGVTPVPHMDIYTPLFEVAPTSFDHGAEFVSDLGLIGLKSTHLNGESGFMNLGWDFNEYLGYVYDHADFDAYMVFYGLGRIPDQVYSLLHTSQDCLNYPGRRNAVGVNDPADGSGHTIDELTETVKFSLDLGAIESAAKEVQEKLYTPTLPNADNFALSYMTLYSRTYFNAFSRNLEGIVKSPGYGSDNSWTWLNLDSSRTESPDKVIVYINGEVPDSFNPCYATTAYAWNILGQTMDSLTSVNPYNHQDREWLATDWTITKYGVEPDEGMLIDFTLRDDVEWQDGTLFTAYDVDFCLEFLRDYQVPRYAETWETLVDVTVTDATHLTINASKAGIGLFYDYSGLAPFIPEHIWNRFGDPSDPVVRKAVLDYDPKESYNVASPPYVYKPPPEPYTPGPIALPSNVFGTGPWVFQFWDPVGEYDEMTANRNYFLKQTANPELSLEQLMEEMFHEVGDVKGDGDIDVRDLDEISRSFGYFAWQPEAPEPPPWGYDPDCDITHDDIVDSYDIVYPAYYLDWQKLLGPP